MPLPRSGFYRGYAASDQRHGFFVVHPHIAKVARMAAAAKVFRRCVRPSGVNVDEAHLGRAQRRFASASGCR